MEIVSVKEYKYAIVATSKELLHEAFQLTKILLKSGCVSFEEYNFNDTLVKDINGNRVFYRLFIKYHRSINFTIVDNEYVPYDEYTYNFRRITESGVTLYGFLTRYLTIGRIEYSGVGMAEKWRDLVDMSEKMEKLMQVPRTKDVKRILNNIYGRGTKEFNDFMDNVSRYCPGFNLKDIGKNIDIFLVDECRPTIDEVVYSELDSYSMQKLLEEIEMNRRFEIKKVIFNGPATIILWSNGDKTVVKCRLGDTFDPEKGLAMAISKYVLGNNYEYYNTFKHYLKPYSKKESHDAVDLLASNLDQIRKGLEEFSYLGKK